jgi:uncharacterized protein (TIGR03435 family)
MAAPSFANPLFSSAAMLPPVNVLPASAIFTPRFSAADIHAGPPDTILEMRNRFVRCRYEFRTATMVDLIRTAWNVDADKVVDGPDWGSTPIRSDVIAPAPPGSNAAKRQLPSPMARFPA